MFRCRNSSSRNSTPCRSLVDTSSGSDRGSESRVDTAAGNARRALREIFESAGVKHAHPHRFRDTFSVGLLENGVSIETLAMLLGHADIRITQKHYAPWVWKDSSTA